MSKVRVGGAWKQPATTRVKIAGVWRLVSIAYVKINGVWKITTLAGAPATPTLTHTALGQFTISNYDANLVYTLTRVSGSGTASRVGAVITLSDPTARFSITAAYAVGTSASAAGFMERKAYTYTFHITNSYTHGWPAHSGSGGGTYSCTWSPENNYAQHYEGYTSKDPTPGGFVDEFGEWARVA